MQLKPLTRDEVMIRLIAEPEFLPVEGNASATDDDALDREIAQRILRRLDQGDVWAWAMVTVTVCWGPFSASDYLGSCCYEDEADFCQSGGYYDDMVEAALEALNSVIQKTYQDLKTREQAA